MTTRKQLDDADSFARKTFKEVTFWDWLGRVLPMTVLAVISVCYFFKWHDALELALEISTVAFFIICFIWWYWAIYKIAITVKYVRDTQKNFSSVLQQIKEFKKEYNNDSTRQRGKQKSNTNQMS